MDDSSAPPADVLDDALSRLESTRGERDKETVADRQAAAERVAETAADHPSIAAERGDAVCEEFLASLEGEGGTVAQDTVPGRADAVADVSHSLARAVGVVADSAGESDPVVDAVVTGLRSEDARVVAASAEAAESLVEAGTPPERVVAALSGALATADGEALDSLVDRLSTLVDVAPESVAPHADGLVDAAADRSVQTTVLRLLASLAEAAPDALTPHTDRLADTADQFRSQNQIIRDRNAARITAPVSAVLYALAEAQPAAVADEAPIMAGFVVQDPDNERSARGVRALRAVASERPDAVADPEVVEALTDYLHDVGVVNESVVDASAAPAALETLTLATRSRAAVVAERVGRVLDAVRRTSADGDRHAAALTAEIAEEHPTAVAGSAAALGDLLARADSPAAGRDYLAAVNAVTRAEAEVPPSPVVEGVAEAMRTHDDPAVQREGLAVLCAVGSGSPDAIADVTDAVLGALDTLEDSGSTGDALDLIATAARADPASVAERADTVVAAVRRHDTDATSETLLLDAVAETNPGAVTDDVGALVDALDDPAAATEALSALRAVAAAYPDAVADHRTAVTAALRDAANDGASERAVDALAALVAVSENVRDARGDAGDAAAALGDLPDAAAVLDDALSASPPETTGTRRFVLAVFEELVAAAPDGSDVTGEDAAAARRTMTTVQRWAGRVREESTDAVLGTDAMMLRLDARERASVLVSAGEAGSATDADGDRLVDWVAENSGDETETGTATVDYVPAEAVADGATMDLETAVETVAETTPDGSDAERARRTEAARTLTAVGARSPSGLVGHVEPVADLLGDVDATPEDTEATNRTVLATTAIQALATATPRSVTPYAERLVALLSEGRDPEVRDGALGALAFLAHCRADAVVDNLDQVEDAAATAGTDEAATDAAVVQAFAAATRDDERAAARHAGTLATTAASADDPGTADRALFHLRRVARHHPRAVADHVDTVVQTMREGDDAVADRAAQVVGWLAAHDAATVMGHLPAVADLLVRADPGGTAAKVAVMTLGNATSETPTALIDAGEVDLAATVDAVAAVLAASEMPVVADNALRVFVPVASRQADLIVPHLDTVVAARERFDEANVKDRSLGVLVGVATAAPTQLGAHLETLLEWLVDTDPEDEVSARFLEAGIGGLADVVRGTPEALRPHLGSLLTAGDASPDTRETALSITYFAVRGDLDSAADHLDQVVALTERTTQEGTKFGAATVLGASYVGAVPRETARRVGRAIASAPDPVAIVQYLMDSLAPEPDGCTALVAMLQGVAAASEDRRVAVVAEVGIVRALSESSDAATAGAAGDCLATMGSVTAPYADREQLIRD